VNLPSKVMVREVGPRDGLQLEQKILSTEDKIYFLSQLSNAGLKAVEATSFVNPRAVPQHHDAEAVVRGAKLADDKVRISALIANLTGLERALAADVREVNVAVSASELHNLKNVNMTVEQSLGQLRAICRHAENKISIRASISMVFGCPYQGETELSMIMRILEEYLTNGITDIALCDTAGFANPRQVFNLVEKLRAHYPLARFALHMHDTRGMGLTNIFAGLQAGIDSFESSLGGLGGCPFIPGASGNVPTEDMVFMFDEMGISTGINFGNLVLLGRWLEGKLAKRLPGRMLHENVCRFREE